MISMNAQSSAAAIAFGLHQPLSSGVNSTSSLRSSTTNNSTQTTQLFKSNASTSTAASEEKRLPAKWLIVNDHIYDMTEFADAHPGGFDLIEDYLEQDVTQVMSDTSIHKHSKNAFSMLNQYLVGKASDYLPNYKSTLSSETITAQDANDPVNYQQPLCHQVGLMGNNYFHWVHNTSPVYFKDPVPLFGNVLIESLSHTPWYLVPLVWIPFILCNLYISSQIHNSQISTMCIGYFAGFLAWFGIEILFHKFLFHWDSLGEMGYYLTNIAHFLLHGFHHKVPMDKDRLVVPPALMCVLSAPVYLLVKLLLPSYSNLLIAGAFSGYIFYDMHHYWLHHQTNMKSSLLNPISYYVNSDYWKTLKSHHFIHHFEEGGDYVNYGISNRVIDMMMGTLREEYAK